MVASLWKPVRSLAPWIASACQRGRRPASGVAGGGDARRNGKSEVVEADMKYAKAREENSKQEVSGARAKRKSLKLGEMREGALDRAHVCEALANARPSPFLPLFSPPQRRKKPAADDVGTDKASKPPPKSFFRRPLGSDTVAFSSAEGKKLLRAIMAQNVAKNAEEREQGLQEAVGYADGFLDLMSAFEMQQHPVSCGVATLTIALNALKVPPTYSSRIVTFVPASEEDVFDALVPLEDRQRAMNDGLSLNDLAGMARRVRGIDVKIVGGEDDSFINEDQEFRNDLLAATSFEAAGRSSQVLVVNFSRPLLGQTGGGHFSPVAAVNLEHDAALVLDTARFKYPPFWVPIPVLWRSLVDVDKDVGKPRGYLLLSRSNKGK